MNVLVYAISRDDARAPAAPELHEICAAGLRALAGPVDTPLAPDLEQLVRYEETMERVMQSHTILPMRYGSIVEGEDGVRELLKSRAREFGTALSRLDGAAEFSVHASVESEPPGAVAPASVTGGRGVSYMRARLDEQRLRDELQGWLEDALHGTVRESVYRTTPAPGPVTVRGAYLVEREAQEEFLTRLAELSETPRRRLSWSGPWPPYTFAEAAAG